jgi:hypothetical protein
MYPVPKARDPDPKKVGNEARPDDGTPCLPMSGIDPQYGMTMLTMQW